MFERNETTVKEESQELQSNFRHCIETFNHINYFKFWLIPYCANTLIRQPPYYHVIVILHSAERFPYWIEDVAIAFVINVCQSGG